MIDKLIAEAKEQATWDIPESTQQLLLQLAKVAEKQIPQNPIGKHTDYKCPVCGRRVRSGKGSSSHSRDNFCQRCGQTLDWRKEE